MDLETGAATCDWCERPATRGFGPATGATHHICSVHDAADEMVEALKDLIPVAQRFFIDYAPDAQQDMECGALIRRAHAAFAKAKS